MLMSAEMTLPSAIEVHGVQKVELLFGHQVTFAATVLANLVAGGFDEAPAAGCINKH